MPRPVLRITHQDQSPYRLIIGAINLLQKEGLYHQAQEIYDRLPVSIPSYEEALGLVLKYIDVERVSVQQQTV